MTASPGDTWAWARTGAQYEPTDFIGRRAELRAVAEALRQARVVTLKGPGGIGKTRIALRAGHRASGELADGVSFVELSGLRDADLLPNAVAAAVGLPETEARESMDALLAYFRDKRALLVLDTCEHLVDAVAVFVDILVRNTQHLVVLLTSRQPVSLPGEYVLPVPPMPEPDSDASEARNDTVALFVARAKAARPSFVFSDDNRAEVIALCRRLDGIPLAIELAAARLRTMTLEQILRRLDSRLKILTGARSAQARHSTLCATIESSHELCSPVEQELWARLSVFAGGFPMVAVEDVCDGGELDGHDVIEVLLGLIDKSVVQRIEDVEEDRYRLLDTLAEYGAERLEHSGRTEVFAARHHDFFLRLATRAVAAEADDIRPWPRPVLPHLLRRVAVRPGDPEGVVRLRALADELDDDFLRARAAYTQAMGEAIWGSTKEAVEQCVRVHARAGTTGDPFLRTTTSLAITLLKAAHGDPQGALAATEQGLNSLAHIPKETYNRNLLRSTQVLCLLILGRMGEARDLGRSALPSIIEQGDDLGLGNIIEYLAWATAADEEHELAATLLGGAGAVWRKIGQLLWGEPGLKALHDQCEQTLIQALGAERFTRLYSDGAARPVPELAALAIGRAAAVPAHRRGTQQPADRRTPGDLQTDRRRPHRAHPHQTRHPLPHSGRHHDRHQQA